MIQIELIPSGFHCITNIEDTGMREQMEAMMGGYGIRRVKYIGYPNVYYIGTTDSLEWFSSILRMYGFQVKIIETTLKYA